MGSVSFATPSRPIAPKAEALQRIDEALAVQAAAPAYRLRHFRAAPDGILELRQYVRREYGRPNSVRIETNPQFGRAGQAVFVENNAKAFKIQNGSVSPVATPPRFYRSIPGRLSSAQSLDLAGRTTYEVEEGFTYFGKPARRVTIALPAETVRQFNANPDALRSRLATTVPQELTPADERDKDIDLAELMYPAAYVYVLQADVPFVLSWQSYSYSGRRLYDVSARDVEVLDDLPDAAFAIPEPPKNAPSASRPLRFRFKGIDRLKLFFLTPNQCATVLGMLAVIALGFHARVQKRPRWSSVAVRLATLALILLLCGAVALTYSRGGALAFLVGLGCFFWLTRSRTALALAAGFLLILILVPNGAARVSTVVDFSQDDAILNRLSLWRGTLAMIADHPLRGVGPEWFRFMYQTWYQPDHLRLSYGSAVNDYLTLAAYFGLPVLAGYGAVISMLLITGTRAVRAGGSPVVAGFVSAMLCYLVAASSSTFAIYKSVFFPFLTATLLLAILVFRYRACLIPTWRLDLLRVAGGVLCAVLLIYSMGLAIAQEYGSRPGPFSLQSGVPVTVTALPRSGEPRGSVILLFETWDAEFAAREALRPFAAAGYRSSALWADMRSAASEAQTTATLRRLASEGPRPLIILGQGEAARFAEFMGNELKPDCVAIVGARTHRPIDELLRDHEAKPPIAILHGGNDEVVDPDESRRYHQLLRARRSAMHIISNADHMLEGRWDTAASLILEFSASSLPAYNQPTHP